MANDKEKHTPESVAAKVVKALLKTKLAPKPTRRKTKRQHGQHT